MTENNFFRFPILDEWGIYILVSVFVVLLTLETFFALRNRRYKRNGRWLTNALMSAVSLPAARLLLIPATVFTAWWAREQGIGIMNLLHLPDWLILVLSMFLLDYFIYVWHRLNHRVPFLWRFHQVHHADMDMDITTAIRFHVGEMLLSIPFRLAVILTFGISPVALLVYEIIFEAATLFHHSNIKIPLGVERILSRFIITPRIHGIHHSIVKEETDSNYSTVLNWWDRAHRTLRLNIAQRKIDIGIPAVRDKEQNSIWNLLILPFRENKEWRLPDGTIPQRTSGDQEKGKLAD